MAFGNFAVLSVPSRRRLRGRRARKLRTGFAARLSGPSLVVLGAGATISMLPDFLCSRLTGTLAEAEAVVATAEAAPAREPASESVRPDIELPGAMRWLRPPCPPGPRRTCRRNRPPARIALLGVSPPSVRCARPLGPRRPSSAFAAQRRHISQPASAARFRPPAAATDGPEGPSPTGPGPDPPAGSR